MPRKLSEGDQSLWICEHTLAGAVPGRAAAPSDSRAQGPGHFNKGRGFPSDEASREGSLPLQSALGVGRELSWCLCGVSIPSHWVWGLCASNWLSCGRGSTSFGSQQSGLCLPEAWVSRGSRAVLMGLPLGRTSAGKGNRKK